MANLLVTGGAGYIGSHVLLALLEYGHNVVVLDNFSNSTRETLRRVADLAGESAASRLTVIKGDIRNASDIARAFSAVPVGTVVNAVLHFAGLKAVGESVQVPLNYWDVNSTGTCQLLKTMQSYGCRTLVFSSSCTVYGTSEMVPISEDSPILPINPYGYTKAAVEQMLSDLALSQNGWRIASLRYFNPVGAHPSRRIGEDPMGIPNNLFPLICHCLVGRRKVLHVYGNDWPTPDGTCIRDYIHVMDLVDGHIAALDKLLDEDELLLKLNLGTGYGFSVLEVLTTFEQVSNRSLPFEVVQRRPGDAAIAVADSELAFQSLGWRAKRGLEEMCSDALAWQVANPNGYTS
jgi:UDP-glucose 4-epimerase